MSEGVVGKGLTLVLGGIVWLLPALCLGCRGEPNAARAESQGSARPRGDAGSPRGESHLDLPAPAPKGTMSVPEALRARRSQRDFSVSPLSMAELGQLAWAAQGVTARDRGLRTAPSAGALYPLELYFLVPQGVLHYLPLTHRFERKGQRDLREPLSRAALDQPAVSHAACDVVVTSVTDRTRQKYGERAKRYVALEAGHASQNLLLQATALGMATVPIGAFDDAAVKRLLALPSGEEPLYIIAVGHPR